MTRARLRGAALRAAKRAAKASPPSLPPPPDVEAMRWAHDASASASPRDRQLLLGYATGTQHALSHASHVRLAWLCLRWAEGDVLRAIEAFRASQQAWIAATRRTAGYHETLTRAYLELVGRRRAEEARRLQECDDEEFGVLVTSDSGDFIERWPELLDHSALADNYGPGAFEGLKGDERARREWVSPEEWRARRA